MSSHQSMNEFEWMCIYIPHMSHIMSHGGLQFYWVRSNVSLWRLECWRVADFLNVTKRFVPVILFQFYLLWSKLMEVIKSFTSIRCFSNFAGLACVFNRVCRMSVATYWLFIVTTRVNTAAWFVDRLLRWRFADFSLMPSSCNYKKTTTNLYFISDLK